MQEALDMSAEERRLKQMLRDPKIGAYFNTRETGEHYLLSSGRHTDEFYQMAKAFRFEQVRRFIADILIEKIRGSSFVDSVEVLIGVPMGGIPLLYELQKNPLLMHAEAIWLEKERDPIKALALKRRRAERLGTDLETIIKEPEFILNRNFKIDPDKQALVIEDVISTGGSVRAVVRACSDYDNPDDPDGKEDPFTGANIVGVVAAVNRMSIDADMLKISPVLDIIWALRDPLNSWAQEECPYEHKLVPLKRI